MLQPQGSHPSEGHRNAKAGGATGYELWDYDTGNAINSYASLRRALETVQAAIARDGEGTLEGLILFEVARDGTRRVVARDRDLIPLIASHAE